jgi:hypothetical protein
MSAEVVPLRPLREGDIVDHGPTGETWVVSAVSGDELIPGGWPETIAKVADCTLVELGTDDDHRDMVSRARVSSSEYRGRWARAHHCPVCDTAEARSRRRRTHGPRRGEAGTEGSEAAGWPLIRLHALRGPDVAGVPATPLDVAEWLHEHPEDVAAVLMGACVALAWQDFTATTMCIRHQLGAAPEEYLAEVMLDEETGRWVVTLRDVEHDDDYATCGEALAAADAVLVEDGYALVGGAWRTTS